MEVDLNGVIASDKSKTTAYLAIVEAIVNSLQSIKESQRTDGKIVVDLIRSGQISFDAGENTLPHIESVHITDNGIGFNNKNRKSFGTLFSTHKKDIGGKGYGRITFLKHFNHVSVDSVYQESESVLRRKFNFLQGMNNDNLDSELVSVEDPEIQTTVKLTNIKSSTALDKKVETVSRKILEMLLPYFLNSGYKLPQIIIKSKGKQEILNDLIKNTDELVEVARNSFQLTELDDKEYKFVVVIYKIFFSYQSNRISLVAHHREVVETNLSEYINEFAEPFIEEGKAFVIKAYVISDYLDENVKHQRTGFNFSKSTPTLEFGITQNDIEKEASHVVKTTSQLADKIETRTQAKMKKVQDFVVENPWHKSNLNNLDYSTIPSSPSDSDIELALHKLQFEKERNTKDELNKIVAGTIELPAEQVEALLSSITEINKDQLAKYVSHRKLVIDFLRTSLEIKDDGKYSTESAVHNLIFPKNSDSETCEWNEHNLWLLDERLTFTQYVTSDKTHVKESKDRSDILVFDKNMIYRTGEDAGNPVTIFELKRPQRFDYLGESSKEDPVEQILRYCEQIKTNTLTDDKGRTIKVHENTPFYGYIVSDINGKVEEWLKRKDFKIMPDGNGWYYWHGSYNLYVEFMGWDKVWKDAQMRNSIFFQKLGIN